MGNCVCTPPPHREPEINTPEPGEPEEMEITEPEHGPFLTLFKL